MKSILFTALIAAALIPQHSHAAAEMKPADTVALNTPAPEFRLKDQSGKVVSLSSLKGKVVVLDFWATWCVPCKKEIKMVREKMAEWKTQADFNYMTISEDDSRATAQVKAYAKSQGWDFPYYQDPNFDLKRSLNFQNVPFSTIVDKQGKVAYMQSGYEAGGEEILFTKIKELAAK